MRVNKENKNNFVEFMILSVGWLIAIDLLCTLVFVYAPLLFSECCSYVMCLLPRSHAILSVPVLACSSDFLQVLIISDQEWSFLAGGSPAVSSCLEQIRLQKGLVLCL